ncbi:TPA: helix-turn-helix transcriptional regulator [Neisseria meningitidis]|nr:MAG TPA: Repressor protein CI [Bacteriophage sp.]
MDLKDRLQELMNDYGLITQQDLADFAGVSKGLVGQWFSGQTGLGKKPLLAFEKKTNFSTRWLADGLGNKYRKDSEMYRSSENLSDGIADDRIRFERLNVVAALGDGYINNEAVEVVDFVHVDKAWAREKLGGNLSRIQVITARGDSMQGTIEDGDVLFVDTSVRSFEGEGVYLLSFADGLKAKRLQASVGGGLLVISDNPLYQTETVEGGRLDDLTICGRVRGAWHLSGF